MTEEIVSLKKGIEDLDEVVEEAIVNDLCYDEDAYAQTAVPNLEAFINASGKKADAGDQTSKQTQTPAVTKSETPQPGSTQCSDLCHDEYWTAAGLGFTTSAE